MTNYPQLESLWLQSSLTFKCWMGVGGKCTTRRKWDRDWVGAPGPVFSLWHSYAFNALLDLLETKCCQNGMFWRKMSYKRLCQFARLYFDSVIER